MSQPNRIRHSLCALEGDISITDVVIERNQNEEYLIPSLLALKHKVERLFGVQPSVSLSESRVSKTADLCENEAMKRQFRLYAESVLESRKKSDGSDGSDRSATAEKEIDIDLGSEIEEVNESLLAGDPLISGSELNGAERKLESNGSELERLPFSNAEEWKPGKPRRIPRSSVFYRGACKSAVKRPRFWRGFRRKRLGAAPSVAKETPVKNRPVFERAERNHLHDVPRPAELVSALRAARLIGRFLRRFRGISAGRGGGDDEFRRANGDAERSPENRARHGGI